MDDPRYEHAAEAAAHVVNLLAGDLPPAERFGKILFAILESMHEAEARLRERRAVISRN